VHRIAPARFRQLMAEDPDLSDILLEAFRARREVLTHSGASRGVELVGSAMDSASLALRTYAARRRLPHLWIDSDSVAGQALMAAAALTSADLPAALIRERVRRPEIESGMSRYLVDRLHAIRRSPSVAGHKSHASTAHGPCRRSRCATRQA
jgi:thioredoxin reductase (NADPH)